MQHFLLWNFGLARAETQTTQDERQCIAKHAGGRRRAAEIGVWHGVTTRVIRSAMSPDGVLFAIDPFPAGRLGFSPQRRIARSTVADAGSATLHWLRTTGELAAKEPAVVNGGVDFVFIDGDHSYDGLKADWLGWSPLVVPGGVVALHDSRSHPGRCIDDAGSVRFTNEVVRVDNRFEVIDQVDSLTVLRRTAPPTPG